MESPLEKVYKAAGPLVVGTAEGAVVGTVFGRTEVGAVAGLLTALLIHLGARWVVSGEESQAPQPVRTVKTKPASEMRRGSAVVGPKAPTFYQRKPRRF